MDYAWKNVLGKKIDHILHSALIFKLAIRPFCIGSELNWYPMNTAPLNYVGFIERIVIIYS